MTAPNNATRVTGSTTEQLIAPGRATLLAIIPENTTTGTVTVRDGAKADGSGSTTHICAVGLTQQGKTFGPGGFRAHNGITVQLSVSTDAVLVIWQPRP